MAGMVTIAMDLFSENSLVIVIVVMIIARMYFVRHLTLLLLFGVRMISPNSNRSVFVASVAWFVYQDVP